MLNLLRPSTRLILSGACPLPRTASARYFRQTPSRAPIGIPRPRRLSSSLSSAPLPHSYPLLTTPADDLRSKLISLSTQDMHVSLAQSILPLITATALASDHQEGLNAILVLARNLGDEGNLDEACGLLDRAISAHGKHSNENHAPKSEEWLAEALGVKSLLLRDTRDLDAALEAAQQSTEIWERLLASDAARYQASLAGSLMNLGCRFHDVNEFEMAIPALTRAVTLCKAQDPAPAPLERFKTLGEALIQLATTKSRIDPNDSLEQLDEAIHLATEAWHFVGADFAPTMIESLSSMMRQHLDLGNVEEAAQIAQAQMSVFASLGGDAPLQEAAAAMTDSAESLLEHGLLEESSEVVKLVMDSPPDVVGEETSAALAFVYAACLSELRQWDAALVQIGQSIALYQQSGPQSSPQLATAYHERSRILSAQNQALDALDASETAVKIQRCVIEELRSVDMAESANLAPYLVQLGLVQLNLGHRQEARITAEEAIALCRKHLEMFASHTHLADAHLLQLKVYAAMEDHARVVQAADEVQVILENFLETDVKPLSTMNKLVESIELTIPSLHKLEKHDDVSEAKQLLTLLRTVQGRRSSIAD